MYHKNLVVWTKLTPPRIHKRILIRQRLTRRFLDALDYRLTLVQAGAGHGKSTALSALALGQHPLAWYHIEKEDRDTLVFLLHLVHSFHSIFPHLSAMPLALLEGGEGSQGNPAWPAVVDALANALIQQVTGPLFFVLDDVHLLNKAPDTLRILDRFIEHAPPDIHIILSSRTALQLPSLVKWHVEGMVLDIGQRELSFTAQEIATLFHEHYRVSLLPEDVDELTKSTEGWAIALQLVWQGLRSGAVSNIPQAIDRLSSSTENFFTYLAQEVLDQQPPEIRDFLLSTAVLHYMTPAICDCIRGTHDSDRILRTLLDTGLFVVDMGDGQLRYHHLIRDFLLDQAGRNTYPEACYKAASCYRQHGEIQEAIIYLLSAGAFDEAAGILEQVGRDLVWAGRLDTLVVWLNALPPDVLHNHPALMAYLGDIARLQSRFDEALRWYRQAETQSRATGNLQGIGLALRGQARVYLDTVNPSQAEELLQEALRLSDGEQDRESRVRLLELLAENRLNLGHPEEARQFQSQAQVLRVDRASKAELAVRVLLRTGRFTEAIEILEERLAKERKQPVLRPRAHRETLLILSLILSFQGQAAAAYNYALEGTQRGQDLNSPFVTGVGLMRQGHGLLLLHNVEHNYEAALDSYQKTLKISESLGVPRLKVEAYWGLCRAYGFRGDIDPAVQYADLGLDLARQAGDEWIAALIRVSLGAGYVLSHRYADAVDCLTQAWNGFHECGDPYGQAVTRLWQCLIWWHNDDHARLKRDIMDLLSLIRQHHYDYLFTRQTLLGPPQPSTLVPLLLFARDHDLERPLSKTLLAHLGLAGLESHPGYRLNIQALGAFRIWRGSEEVAPQDWRREKARQLFLLLLSNRDKLLARDQIIEMLWPGIDLDTGLRDFKVALSTLYRVLEPGLRRGQSSSYILRDNTLYGLRPHIDLWLDIEEFEQYIATGDNEFETNPESAIAAYRQAMQLYQGDYLQEYIYEDWCSEERERLLVLYLRMADRLAQALIGRELWQAALDVCQAILSHDDCWEQAYRFTMIAYDHLGNRAQALRTYHRCVVNLQRELDIAPSLSTIDLYNSLLE